MTGYDNTDVSTGKADTEVFLYRAEANGGEGELLCASCNPSGARPQGGGPNGNAAGQIPASANNLYASRVLSDDGNRLFFESYDALTPRDSNGKKDVYQWEAPNTGLCTTTSPTYSPLNGGCIDLISSGQSKLDSQFADATPSGDDVFFTTLSSLLPQDYGLVDVYDARVDGGLPTPPPPPPGCEGEGCQSPAAAPEFQTPATNATGPGNLTERGSKPRACAKGRRRVSKGGGSRCVKKKSTRRSKLLRQRGRR